MSQPKNKPGDSLPDVKKSRTAEATGGVASTRPEQNAVYTGEIIARQSDGTYRVALEDPQIELDGVRLAFPVLGGLLGLQVISNLPQNTKVKIAYGTPAFIFAVIPENNTDWKNARNRSLIYGAPMDAEQGVEANNFSAHAEDLLEGEVEFTNLFGVALQFLTSIMRMSAGDRALVECHLQNDMVRIISAQYRHISGLGDELMFDHGRPTLERSWSSYRHEVLGALQENDPYVELNGDEVDRDALDEKRVTGIGRYRFREFLGYAGDFIHSFVTDPPATIASLAKDMADSGAGKSLIHRNSDGSIIINSVADIRIERTVRVPVAVRQKHHEDPEVWDTADDYTTRAYDDLNKAFLKLPDMISPVDPKDAYKAAYHLRSHGRWLGRYHAFARMLQLEEATGEYKVPSEDESPVPDWNNGEPDRKDQNPRVKYYDAYACITILRDGSIVNHDGYGSSIVMSNGNIQVSAARHLDLEAAGDVRIVAGGSFLVKARRNIELSATLGGIVLHSYAWFKALCEQGTMWLRSNAPADRSTAPEPKEQGGPTPEIAGWEQDEADGFAMLIEAADGITVCRSQKGMAFSVDGQPDDVDDPNCDITFTTNGDVDIHSGRKVDIRTPGVVRVAASRSIALSSDTLLSNAADVLIGPNMTKPSFLIRSGSLWCNKIYSELCQSNNIAGPPRPGRVPTPDPAELLPNPKQHYNHIDTLRTKLIPPVGADDFNKLVMSTAAQLASSRPSLPWKSPSDGPVWAFPGAEEYVWDNRESTLGTIPETLTQQYLRLDAALDPDRWDGLGYVDWELKSTLHNPRRTNTAAGFGTYEEQYRASDEGENLHAPSATAPRDMVPPVSEWEAKPSFTIQALKREGEL